MHCIQFRNVKLCHQYADCGNVLLVVIHQQGIISQPCSSLQHYGAFQCLSARIFGFQAHNFTNWYTLALPTHQQMADRHSQQLSGEPTVVEHLVAKKQFFSVMVVVKKKKALLIACCRPHESSYLLLSSSSSGWIVVQNCCWPGSSDIGMTSSPSGVSPRGCPQICDLNSHKYFQSKSKRSTLLGHDVQVLGGQFDE